MSEITPEFIAKLRDKLATAETPLPWKFTPVEREPYLSFPAALVVSGAFITPFTLEFGDEFMGLHDVDAALIVEAVNALPALLDEIERQRALIQKLELDNDVLRASLGMLRDNIF